MRAMPLDENSIADSDLPAGTPAPQLSVEIDDDGGVTLYTPSIRRPRSAESFDENLAEVLDDEEPAVLGQVAYEVLDGVESDIQSRADFISNYEKGIDLLGLKIEEPSNTRGPQRSISRSKHVALLQAIIEFQGRARDELLPAEGPVKAVNIGEATEDDEIRANGFQDDFNYYLTEIAKEYYPNTDQGLFYEGFCGNMFKKVHLCPIKRRPVSETVPIQYLIVNETATDLDTALRVTHETVLNKGIIKRMMLNKAWREVSLGMPMPNTNRAQLKIQQSGGLASMPLRTQDIPSTFYETDVEFDLSDLGWVDRRAPEGLPVPYTVTVEKTSQQVVAMRRNWKMGDEQFRKRQRYVHFGMIPGLGFLNYGFLHLIGNQTRVLTGILQLLIDSGMLANFPGGLKAKGLRTSTNEMTPGLGEFVDIDVPGGMDDIRKAIMTMPYKDVSAGLIQIYQMLEQQVKAMSGTVELETGEGRTNVPVGTILAQIEQQTQVMAAVHKRNHTAQKLELTLLRDLFLEDPAMFHKIARKPERVGIVAYEFADISIRPASDPNVPSSIHRLMQAQALEQMGAGDPQNLNRRVIHQRAFRAMRISDGDSLLNPLPAPGSQPPPPEAMAAQLEQQKLQQTAQQNAAQNQIAQAKIANDKEKQQRQASQDLLEAQERSADRQAGQAIESEKLDIEKAKLATDADSAHRDRGLDAAKHLTGLAQQANSQEQDALKAQKPEVES